MAAPKTLTERLEAIINSLGATPVKGELIKLLRSVKLLEGGHATRKKEAKISTLKAENENLKVQLRVVQAQIEQYQAEQAKQAEPEMPPVQLEILKGLPDEGVGNGATLEGIARRANIPAYEAAVHLDKLEKAGLAKKGLYARLRVQATIWHRTIPGSELILAIRLASETDNQKTHKHADLPKVQHDALMKIGSGPNGADEVAIAETIGASLLLTQRTLRLLRKAEMATSGDEPQQTYGGPEEWWLLENGEEYLAERALL